jgi:hypothetical protein
MGEAITRHSLHPLRFAEGECDQDPDAMRGAGTVKHVSDICIDFLLVIISESEQFSTPTPVGSCTGVSGVAGDGDVRTSRPIGSAGQRTKATPRGCCWCCRPRAGCCADLARRGAMLFDRGRDRGRTR